MPLLKIEKLTDGLAKDWSGFLHDWDRSLRAGNYPETTRYNYLLAAAQLGRYLAEHSPDPDADAAAEDAGQGVPDDGRAQVPDVHLLGDVRLRVVDHRNVSQRLGR